MSELGPTSLDVASEHKVELLVDIKVAVVYPEMVKAIFSQMRLTRSQNDV